MKKQISLMLLLLSITTLSFSQEEKKRAKSFIEIGVDLPNLIGSEIADVSSNVGFSMQSNVSVNKTISIFARVNRYSLQGSNFNYENDIRFELDEFYVEGNDYSFQRSKYSLGTYTNSEINFGVTFKSNANNYFSVTCSPFIGFGVSNYSGETVVVRDEFYQEDFELKRSSSSEFFFSAGISGGIHVKFSEKIPLGLYIRNDIGYITPSHYGTQENALYENSTYFQNASGLMIHVTAGIVIFL